MRLVFFDGILEAVRQAPPRRVAVAAASGESLIRGLCAARDLGLARPLFFGDVVEIERQARVAGLVLSPDEIEHHPTSDQALVAAVMAVREGRCGVLLKGKVPSSDFLRAVLDRARGLRGPGLLSHMAAYEVSSLGRPLFVTDSGLNPYPDLAQKTEILRQGIRFLHRLGFERPRVAILSSSELLDARNPASRDALALTAAAAGDAFGSAVVDGPLALDLAISASAAAIKGVRSPVAGCADLLIVPDVVAGNILGKALLHLVRAPGAGLVLGASAPVVMLSRADDAATKLRSLALAIAADPAGLP